MQDQNEALVPYSASCLVAKSQARSDALHNGSKFHAFAPENLRMSPFVWVPLALIRAYQFWVPDRWKRKCIYAPSCSDYATICILRAGFSKGFPRALERLRRCDSSKFLPGADIP